MVKSTNIRVSEKKEENTSDKNFVELLNLTKENNATLIKILPEQNATLQEILKELKAKNTPKKGAINHIDEEIKRIKLEEAKLRLQKAKSGTSSKSSSNKISNNINDYDDTDLDPRLDSKKARPFNDSSGGPWSSTLLSIMTGGVINPAVANMLGLDKLLKRGANAIFTANEKRKADFNERYGTSDKGTSLNPNIPNEKGIAPGKTIDNSNKKLNDSKLTGLLPTNDNNEENKDEVSKKPKERKSSAIDKAEDAPVLNRLDRMIELLKDKNKNKNSEEKPKEKESILSKIFGIFKGIISGGMLLLSSIWGGAKKLVAIGLTIKAVQAAMGLINLLKSTISGLISAAEQAIAALKGLFNKNIPNLPDNKNKNKGKKEKTNSSKSKTSDKKAENTKKSTSKGTKASEKTVSKTSKLGKAANKVSKAASKVGKIAKVGGKILAPVALASSTLDAAETVNDIKENGWLGTGDKYEAEARAATVTDNVLGLLNPMKFAHNIEALAYKGLEKLFGTKEERAYEDFREDTREKVFAKIDAMYNDPRYRNENNLFDLNRVDEKDRGAAFDYLVHLVEKTGGNPNDPYASGTMIDDYIKDINNYNEFHNKRMYERATDPVTKQLAQSYIIRTENKMSEETYMANVRNQQDQARMNQLTDTITNNNTTNNTTNNTPTVINNNISMLKEYNAYNSGPAANTLAR